MPSAQKTIPHDSVLLCERCGYILDGLPAESNCPECGQSIARSLPSQRHAPSWEIKPSLNTFFRTSACVLFRPRRFYRTLNRRGNRERSWDFAVLHWLAASLLLSAAAALHGRWYLGDHWDGWGTALAGAVLLTAVYPILMALNVIAARLTAWEAAYRGLRLPLPVVMRALEYHSVHYVPVAGVALATVLLHGALWQQGWLSPQSLVFYLYVLCGEVILAAGYLFHTYWIAMRNLMFANG